MASAFVEEGAEIETSLQLRGLPCPSHHHNDFFIRIPNHLVLFFTYSPLRDCMDCRYDSERGRPSCCDDGGSIISSEAHSPSARAPKRANSASTTASNANVAAAAAGVFVLSKSGPSWVSDRQFSMNTNGNGHHAADRPGSRSSIASSNAWAAVPTPSPRYVGGGGRRTPGRPSEDNMTRPSMDSMRSVSVSSWSVLPDEKRKSQLRSSRMVIDSPNASPAPGLLVNLHGSDVPNEEGTRSGSGGGKQSNSGSSGKSNGGELHHGQVYRNDEEPRMETPRFFAQRFYDIPDSAPATKESSPVEEHPRRRRLVDVPEPEAEAEVPAPVISTRPSWEAEKEFWTPTRSPSAAAMMLRPSPSSIDSSLLMPPADIALDDATNSNNVWASRGPTIHSRPLVLPQVATLAASKRQSRSRAASFMEMQHIQHEGGTVSQSAGPLHAQYNAGPSPVTQRLARVRSHSTIQQERWSRCDLTSCGGSVSAHSDGEAGDADVEESEGRPSMSQGHHSRDHSVSAASSDAYDGAVVSAPAQLIQVAKKSIARTDAILLVGRGAKRYVEAGVQVIPQGALACPRVSVTAATPSTRSKDTPLATRRAKPVLTIDTAMKKGSVESAKTAPLLHVPTDSKVNGSHSATLPPTPVTLQCPKCQHQFDWVANKDASSARSAKSLAQARVEARSAMRSTSVGQLEELAAALPSRPESRARSAASSPTNHRSTRSADGPHGAGAGSFTAKEEPSRAATPLEGLDYHGVPTTGPKIIGSLKSRFDPSFQRNVSTPDQHHYPERSASRSSLTDSFIKLRHRDSVSCLPLSNKTESSLTLADSRPTSSSGSSITSRFPPVSLNQRRHTRASSKSSQTAAETTSISSSNRGALAAPPTVQHNIPTPDAKPVNEVCPWEDEPHPTALPTAFPTSAPVAAPEKQSGQEQEQEQDEWDAALDMPSQTPRTPSKSKALKLLGIPDGAANELPPPLPATASPHRKRSRRRGSSGLEARLSISAPFGVTHSPSPLSRPPTSSSPAPSHNLAGIGSAATRNASRLNTGMSSTSSVAATTGSTTPSGSSVDTSQSQGREDTSYEPRPYGLAGPAALVPPSLLPPPQPQQPGASSGLGKLRNAWKRGGAIGGRTSSTASQPGALLAGAAAVWSGETPGDRKDSKELGSIPSFPLPPSPQPQSSPGQSSSGASMQTATPAAPGGRSSLALPAAQLQQPMFRLPSLDLVSPAEQDDFASMAAAAASFSSMPPPPPFSEAVAEGGRSPASAISASSPASNSSGATATLMQRESPVKLANTTTTSSAYLTPNKASTSHHDGGAPQRAQQQLRERDKALNVLRRRREAETYSNSNSNNNNNGRQGSSQTQRERERGSMDWNPRVDYL